MTLHLHSSVWFFTMSWSLKGTNPDRNRTGLIISLHLWAAMSLRRWQVHRFKKKKGIGRLHPPTGRQGPPPHWPLNMMIHKNKLNWGSPSTVFQRSLSVPLWRWDVIVHLRLNPNKTWLWTLSPCGQLPSLQAACRMSHVPASTMSSGYTHLFVSKNKWNYLIQNTQ